MESNNAFEKILTRILIEFFGNYSLKFISSSLPKKQMVEAIFYGYTAMFWKNLLQPPQGLEDLLLFKNYLSWAKAFKKRASSQESEKEAVIQQMEDVADSILPDQTIRTLVRRKNLATDCLQIALRHGRPGINSAVQYFTMDNAHLPDSSHDRSRTLPKQITTLFRGLRRSYDNETPRTREFIHTFLMELRSAYSPRITHLPHFRKKSRDSLAFTKGRMAHLIQDFSRSLN